MCMFTPTAVTAELPSLFVLAYTYFYSVQMVQATTSVLLKLGWFAEDVFCLFDLILYVPSTIFQLNRDGSSWVEPVLS